MMKKEKLTHNICWPSKRKIQREKYNILWDSLIYFIYLFINSFLYTFDSCFFFIHLLKIFYVYYGVTSHLSSLILASWCSCLFLLNCDGFVIPLFAFLIMIKIKLYNWLLCWSKLFYFYMFYSWHIQYVPTNSEVRLCKWKEVHNKIKTYFF